MRCGGHEYLRLLMESAEFSNSSGRLKLVDVEDILDEWRDALAMVRALTEMVAQLQAPVEQPPAWEVIA
jgi:hypothetical protein